MSILKKGDNRRLRRVLVTGGTGFIGSHLVESLIQKGVDVRCLVRPNTEHRWLSGLTVELMEGDLTDFSSLEAVVSDVDTIFHLAGKTNATSAEGYYQANAQGTMNLLKANMQANGSHTRFIYVSSLSAAGPSADGHPLNEEDSANPLSSYGASKLAGEEAVYAFHPQMPVTVIRPPIVYGPRDIAVLKFFKIIKYNIKPILGWRSRYGCFIFVSDLVEGLIQAAESSKTIGETYYLVSDTLVAYQELNRIIAQQMQKKTLPIHVPVSAFKAVVLLSTGVHKLLGKSILVNGQKAKEIEQRYWICDGTKARNDFQFMPKYTLKEGLEITMNWYKENGWI